MVIAALLNGEKHINYANPPDKNPFNAYYVDAAIGKKTEKEVKPATLKGFIRDKKGNLLEGVKVSIRNADYKKNTNTNINGYYEIKNIYPGTYTLKTEKNDYKTFNKNIRLKEGETFWENITLSPQTITTILKGFVTDKTTEEPIENVKITLHNSTDNFIEYANEDGYYEFKISPGTYTIKLDKKNYKSYGDTVQLSEKKEVY